MTLKWIGVELRTGAWTHVSNLMSTQGRKGKRETVKPEFYNGWDPYFGPNKTAPKNLKYLLQG